MIEPNMKMETRIWHHLEENGSINSLEAIREYGCTRLSQYILLLRKRGLKVVDEWEQTTNRYGEQVHYKRYFIEED